VRGKTNNEELFAKGNNIETAVGEEQVPLGTRTALALALTLTLDLRLTHPTSSTAQHRTAPHSTAQHKRPARKPPPSGEAAAVGFN
jgi:hypothetical protein